MKQIILLITTGAFLLAGCKKEDQQGPKTTIRFTINHTVNGAHLTFDTPQYVNGKNETYSVTRLNYYISGIRLYRNNVQIFTADTAVYIDARNEGLNFLVSDIPAGYYDSLACYIGLDPAHNQHGKLPATAENIAMEWPDVMGGGYHFLKLEGHWSNDATQSGYALHLGNNPYLVEAGCRTNMVVIAGNENRIKITMNVAEWLVNPYSYSFERDGVYTMGNSSLMNTVSKNGRDVLTAYP